MSLRCYSQCVFSCSLEMNQNPKLNSLHAKFFQSKVSMLVLENEVRKIVSMEFKVGLDTPHTSNSTWDSFLFGRAK